ncbi:NADH/ubiquinone/plastoquinone (complex I) [Thioalkalivibrio denitrificans]|uniref:NADH/ubiquinone/plastoquinone (Complex I) n=1 Tax=Thioalkalivibrio denitrificans TaxID=108003 RepID=A0A1V3NCE1_9GAMM|nr:proton-conducting transporter membrane subunit [Thioalkalivibrio denitrificans]OOG22711.1 NADH/ubiquinone/plastoquinone (complex I) [Thioalkalivibrio denitrificans]
MIPDLFQIGPSLLFVAPLFAAIAAFVRPRAGAGIYLVSAGLITVASLALVLMVGTLGAWRMDLGGWVPPLGIGWQVDGLSVAMLLLTALVMGGAGVYRVAEGDAGHSPLFWPLWLFLWGGLNALFLSADLFNLYVTLELVSLAAVALIAMGGRTALVPAWRYFIATLLGSTVFLMGVALLYGQHGSLDMRLLQGALGPAAIELLASLLITLGLLLKGAVFPLHFWLPAAHGRAPSAVSAALSGVVVTAAFYLMVRLWFGPFSPMLTPALALALGAMGAMGILWGGVMALLQRRLKMLIAYSTVSQLGYVLLVFPLVASGILAAQAWHGAVVLILTHGFAKAALFLSAGVLIRSLGHDRIDRLKGPGQGPALAWLAFALGAVSLVGLPPSGGFMAKWWLLQSALAAGAWHWALVILAGSLLTAVYLFRVLGGPTAGAMTPSSDHSTRAMGFTALILALAAWIPGFVPIPLTGALADTWGMP